MRRIITRGMSLGRFPVGLNLLVKPVLAMVLIVLSSTANAVTVLLISHNQTSGSGAVSTLITDGSHTQGQPASTAIWDWDGTSLTSTGLYSAVSSISSSPYTATILNDQVTDMSINAMTATASGTAYVCAEGTFLAGVGASGCGGHNFGPNLFNESTTTWGPGLVTSQTIGGDDVSTAGGPREVSSFDLGFDGFTGVDGLTPGDGVEIGTDNLVVGGVAVGTSGGEKMTFTVLGAVDDTGGSSVRATETINIPVLANDVLVDDIQNLTSADPAHGTTSVMGPFPGPQAGLSIDYTSNVGEGSPTGTDLTFQYTVTDPAGTNSTATVTVNVTNLLPVAVAETPSVDGHATTPVASDINVMASDTLGDTGPGTHSVTITVPPVNGTIGTIAGCDIIATCVVPYTPDAAFFGADPFTYQLQDGNGDTDSAVVTVTVADPNTPSATDDNIAPDRAVPHPFNPLTNDAGLADTPLSISFTQGANGTVTETVPCTAQGTCELTYTSGVVGADSFTYTVTDSTMQDSTATVNVDVNDVPDAVDDATGGLGMPAAAILPATLTSLDVQLNDDGLTDTPITMTVTVAPDNGGTAVPSGNSIDYTSAAGFNGTEIFTYQLADVDGDTDTAVVAIDVNDQPNANDNGSLGNPAFMIEQGTTEVGLDILANDTGLSDTDLTVSIITDPANGSTATVTGSPGNANTIRVDYAAGAVLGEDSFRYRIMDASGDLSEADVYVAVLDPTVPMAFNDAATTNAGETVNVNVLANDASLDDTPLMVTITTDPINGSIGSITGCAAQGPACKVPYTPDAGLSGFTDTFQYMVTDITPNSSNIATVTITVPADIPRAVFDSATTFAGEMVGIDVLANDTRLSDTPLTVTITTDPLNGVIGQIIGCTQPGAVCEVSYTPNAGFSGTDSFQYMLTDSTPDDSNTASVEVTVIEAPNAVDDASETPLSQSVTIDVLDNDTGLANSPLTVTITASPHPDKGTVAVGSDNAVVYTSIGDEETTDTFSYTVTDSNDRSSTALVTVTIGPKDTTSPFESSSSAVGPAGLGLLMLLPWLRRRHRRS